MEKCLNKKEPKYVFSLFPLRKIKVNTFEPQTAIHVKTEISYEKYQVFQSKIEIIKPINLESNSKPLTDNILCSISILT